MIIGKYVTLRIIESKDAEMIRNWKNSHDNYIFFANRDFISDKKQESWISSKLEDDSSLYMIIAENNSLQPIGMTLLEKIDHRNRNASWGIYIGEKEYRKRIFALEATYLILKYGFEYLNLYKIYGNTLKSNKKGRSFHKLVGFNEEATFCNHIFVDDFYDDLIWISIFKKDWDIISEKLHSQIDKIEFGFTDESK